MLIDDGWAAPGWTGVVIDEDEGTALVRWYNGKQLRHMKDSLRIMSVIEGDNPNTLFQMLKYKKANNNDVI